MSNQTTHHATATELDASVDAMADQLAGVVGGGHPAIATIDAPSIPNPPAAASSEVAESDALLAEISSEIEQRTPGTLPTPPEPAPAAPPPAPTPADIASLAADVEADLGAFEAPSALEIAPLPQPPAIEADATKPGAEIRTLDAALAARAERSLLTNPAPADPAPVAPPPAAVATPPVGPSRPEPPPEPIVIVAPAEPEAGQELPAQPRLTRAALLGALAAPLRPVAATHEKLGEPTRQLIGYCAVITLFFAACLWGAMPYFKQQSPDPTTAPTEFYDANTPAHGITAPAKHAEGDIPAAHGESGHGDAKKADAHGAKPKPERKSTSKSRKAPPAGAGH